MKEYITWFEFPKEHASIYQYNSSQCSEHSLTLLQKEWKSSCKYLTDMNNITILRGVLFNQQNLVHSIIQLISYLQ